MRYLTQNSETSRPPLLYAFAFFFYFSVAIYMVDCCVAAAKELGVVRIDLYFVEEGSEEVCIWVCLWSVNDGDKRASTIDR